MKNGIRWGVILSCIFLTTINLLAGEIIGEWNFEDEQNPGKATIGIDASVKGKPTIVVDESRKALQLCGAVITDKKNHNYLKIPNNSQLSFGNTSFSVECWVKADDIGYYQFIGKRKTARPGYQIKGWCLGMEKSGNISFTIDDELEEHKKNAAKVHFLSCDWDLDEWNYLVGVRDCEQKEIRLYINGELSAKVADKAGDITNTLDIRIGYDQMAGVFMDGKLDDIRITRGVLSEKQIQANFSYRLEILPQPQKITYSKEIIPLVLPVKILPTPLEKTAIELLKTDLKKWFNFDVKVTQEATLAKGTLIELGKATPELHSEGYTLEKKADDNVIKISSNDNGIIYGALTLIQILKKTTAYNNNQPAFPNTISINDYPLIANRLVVSGIYFPFNKHENVKKAFDTRMRERLNGIVLSYSKVKKETPEAFKRLVTEATNRGITAWAVYGYRGSNNGKGISPLNPAHRKEVADFFAKAGAAGCRGFSFYFDDITGKEFKTVKNDAKFESKIGLFQQAFIKIMVEEGNKFGITNYVVCPTPYMRGWERSANTWWGNTIKHDNYFKELTDAPGLENVRLYHCDFYPDKIKELRDKGLKKYAYWVNGLWTTQRWFSWHVGPMRLAWTWYGFNIDGEKGPQPLADAQKHWRNIANETDTVILGTGGGYVIAGIWLWNPPAFNDDKAAKATCSNVFGKGSYDLLVKYSKGMAPLVTLFKTYKTSAVSECHPPVIKLKTPLTAEQLTKYWAGLKSAKAALAKLKALPNKQNSIFERSNKPRSRTRDLNQMDVAIEKATKKLKGKLKRNGIDVE